MINENGNVQNMRKPNTTRMEKGIARRALTTGAMSESLPNIVVVIGKVASCATIVVAIASLPVCMKALLLFLNVYGHLRLIIRGVIVRHPYRPYAPYTISPKTLQSESKNDMDSHIVGCTNIIQNARVQVEAKGFFPSPTPQIHTMPQQATKPVSLREEIHRA